MAALSSLLTSCYIYISMAAQISIAASDTLSPHQPLGDGQTLVSADQKFELGFFCPPSRTHNRYLGIWYKNIPLTVVWVANRMRPLQKPGGKLVLYNNGGLVIIEDGSEKKTIRRVPKGKKMVENPILQLLDSGNLVVRDGGNNGSDGGYIWESFDYPSDTLLPGMKLGWDCKACLDREMRSWRNNRDPSHGEFSFGLDSRESESPQLVLRKNNMQQSRWGPWDGQRFSGTNAFKANPLFKPIFISNADEAYFTFQVLDESILFMFVVNPLGNIEFLEWKNHTREWISTVTLNKDRCDWYSSCGPNGICYIDGPNCRCLEGFVAKSPQDWGRLDCSGGCTRKHELNCSDGDGFVKFEGLKLPDKSIVWPNLSPKECGERCLKECTCMGYTKLEVYGNGTQLCIVWLGDLIDIRKFPEGGDELYMRMARSELESTAFVKREKKVMVTIIILSTVSVTLLLIVASRYICQMKRVKRQAETENNPCRESIGNQEEDLDFQNFNVDTISAATNNFSSDNKIGQGGFGIVYKGELATGQQIAVKRLSEGSCQGLQEFKNEVTLIAKLQHRNLVKLLGYSIQGEEKMLVYEYLPNRSLDQFIFTQARKRLLPWEKRFSIVNEVAKGLVYLHDDSRLRIIHRDLKASNILLDSEMNPKISDFGLARIFGDETEETTKRVVGTHGYMSPEYVMNGQFSTRSDVYSFGVLALEIVSGEKNWGFHHPDHDFNLLGHAWKLWNEGRSVELMDSVLKEESFHETEVLRCIQVSLLCVQQRSEDRPTMSSVVTMLRSECAMLPEPQKPGFFAGRTSEWIGSSSRDPNTESDNVVTITTLTGRS